MTTGFKPGRADRRVLVWAAAIALGAVILDRTVKELTAAFLDRGDAWPGDDWPLRLVHVVNTGAAFGRLQGQTELLSLASIVGVLAFAYLLVSRPGRTTHMVGLSLCLGGCSCQPDRPR